jgi:hypothetical protein
VGRLALGGDLELHAPALPAVDLQVRGLAEQHVVGLQALPFQEVQEREPVRVLLHHGAHHVQREGQLAAREQLRYGGAGRQVSGHGRLLVHGPTAVHRPVGDAAFEGRMLPGLRVGDPHRVDVRVVEDGQGPGADAPHRVAQAVGARLREAAALHLLEDEGHDRPFLPGEAGDADQALQQPGQLLAPGGELPAQAGLQLGIHELIICHCTAAVNTTPSTGRP